MSKVRKIHVQPQFCTSAAAVHNPRDHSSGLRVAAYARLSTDEESQSNSFQAQKDYYEKLISKTAGWSFAGIYADQGISGTSTEHRAGFQKMLEDCRAGKIDQILTKSVSRFARNTVDSLRGYGAVVDYAARVKGSTIVDQQPFILEAKRLEDEGCTAEELWRRQEPKKLGKAFTEVDLRKQFDKELRKLVPDVQDEEIELLKAIFLEQTSRREKYIKSIRTFGKERGLVLYRGELRGKLSEKYLRELA